MARNTQKRKCSGHKKTGEPCDAWAIRGGTVCVSHGGGAPQVSAAAEIHSATMAAHDAAQRMLARAGVDADPLEHLLDSLYRAAALMAVWGSMVAAIDARAEEEAREAEILRGELGYYEAGEDSSDELRVVSRDRLLALNSQGMAQIHPYVLEYDKWAERRARFAKLCLDARIDERIITLHQGQVELAQRAFEAMLAEMGMSAAARQEARHSYARHLRAA
jgi:hypothetical protein